MWGIGEDSVSPALLSNDPRSCAGLCVVVFRLMPLHPSLLTGVRSRHAAHDCAPTPSGSFTSRRRVRGMARRRSSMSILGPSATWCCASMAGISDHRIPAGWLQLAYELIPAAERHAPLTREEEQQIQDQGSDQSDDPGGAAAAGVQAPRASASRDAEIIDAARTSPPPEVMRRSAVPDRQPVRTSASGTVLAPTNTDRQLLAQIEAVYRGPRSADQTGAVSHQRIPPTRNCGGSTRTALFGADRLPRRWPYTIQDTSKVSDAELLAYLASTPRVQAPAHAYVRFIALPRMPDASDSRRGAGPPRARAQRAGAGAKFRGRREARVERHRQWPEGGELGWIKRNESSFDPQFIKGCAAEARAGLRPGRHQSGITSSDRSGEGRLRQAAHILIPVGLQGGAPRSREGARRNARASCRRAFGPDRAGQHGAPARAAGVADLPGSPKATGHARANVPQSGLASRTRLYRVELKIVSGSAYVLPADSFHRTGGLTERRLRESFAARNRSPRDLVGRRHLQPEPARRGCPARSGPNARRQDARAWSARAST